MDGISISKEKMEQLLVVTGFNDQECHQLLIKTGWEIDEAINNMENIISGSVGAVYAKDAVLDSIRNAGLYDKLSSNLSNLNTMRGSAKGFKGFVFEELHATDATIKGVPTSVINNNGIADFAIKNADGSITLAQAKIGYNNGGSIDFSAYKGQTIVVDKGNTYLINKANEAGLDVIESDITIKESAKLAKNMQIETKITGRTNSVIVPKADAAIKIAKEANKAGLKSAAKGAQFGGGFSIGTNLVDVVNGDKDIDEAAVSVAKDTAISAGVGYVTGTIATAVGNTVVGAAVGGAVTTAGATVGTALATVGTAAASTAVGGTVVAAGTAVAGTAVAASTAVVGTVAAAGTVVASTAAAAGTAIAGTAAGGAVVAAGSVVAGTVAAAGTAVAGTAIGGAAIAAGALVAGAAVAAAPVVAAGAVLGVGFKIAKKFFRR